MPDLGERGNVMGPQPIGTVVEPPPAMLAAAERLLNAIIRADRAETEAMTEPQARAEIIAIANAVKPGAYDKFALIGRARVAQHYFLKARLTGQGVAPLTFQFRLGANLDQKDAPRWTVREALNLTDRRSAWTT